MVCRTLLIVAVLFELFAAQGEELKPLFDQPLINSSPLRIGEKLTFKVSLLGIPAGWQMLHVAGREVIDGREVVRVVSSSRTNKFFSKIYFFSDFRESLLLPDLISPVRYRKRIEEKRFKAEVEVIFDRRSGTAIIRERGRERRIDVPPDIQDELSMLFLVRTRRMRIGERYFFPLLMRDKVERITVDLLGRVRIKTVLGEVEALVISSSNGHKVWLTDDEGRIPVRIEAKTKLGKAVSRLEGIER